MCADLLPCTPKPPLRIIGRGMNHCQQTYLCQPVRAAEQQSTSGCFGRLTDGSGSRAAAGAAWRRLGIAGISNGAGVMARAMALDQLEDTGTAGASRPRRPISPLLTGLGRWRCLTLF